MTKQQSARKVDPLLNVAICNHSYSQISIVSSAVARGGAGGGGGTELPLFFYKNKKTKK